MRLYLRLLQFVRPHMNILLLAVGAMLLGAFFDSVSLGVLVPLSDKVLSQNEIIFDRELPGFLQQVVDRVNQASPLAMLNLIVAVIPGLIFLKGLFFFIRMFLLHKLTQLVIRDIRNTLYRKIQDFSLSYFSQSNAGQLVSRITYDVEVLKGCLSAGLTDLFYQGVMMFFLAFIVFYVNWKWAVVSLLIVPIVALPIIRVGRMVKKISTQAQERMGELNRKLFETIAGVRVVKAFSMEEEETERVAEQTQGFYKMMMKLQKRSLLLGPFTEFIGACGGAAVLYYGGREVIKGNMSFGVFVLFLGALLSLIKPSRRLSEIHSVNQQALAAATRIFEVLDEPIQVKEKPGARELPQISQGIEFAEVGFSYEEKSTLSDINLKINKGEIIALVGPSGAGKTTLANLLMRFYDPDQGVVKIDGIDLREVTFSSLRGQIGMVPQDLILFNDTVANNIRYGKNDASQIQIEKAAMTAEAHEFIQALPEGYDTVVGDMGVKLSGGQKQRIAIARAILNNPPILILDEATSQLDAESTRLVQEALDRVFVERTVIVIAHRLATVKKATRIVVVEAGRIVEQGTHEELLRQKGLYKKISDLEFIL